MVTEQPIVAFLYDFDKTLCTTDMQDYAFIPSLGMTRRSSGPRPTTSAAATGSMGFWPICIP